MKNKKILIIVIIIIMVLAIAGATLGFILISTDALKNPKDMFNKYFAQNFIALEMLKNSTTYDQYETLKAEGTYESNIDARIKYSEGGEISNPINDLSVKINTKKDKNEEYLYSDAQILYKDEEYLEFELIKDKELAGIRFSDVVKQFVTVRDDENTGKVVEATGIKQADLEDYMAILNGTQEVIDKIVTKEEKDTIKDRYIGIIKENLNKGIYTNLKKVMVTIDNTTVNANAYTLTLEAGQVGDMVMQILETVKTDNIILEKIEKLGHTDFSQKVEELIEKLSDYEKFQNLKITVYQQKGVTIRTDIDFETSKITIENNQDKISIQRNVYNLDVEEIQRIEITKESNENQENYNINISIIAGEEQTNINIINEMQNSDKSMLINTQLKLISGIKDITVSVQNTINKLQSISDRITIDNTNNVVLNDLDEEVLKNIVEQLKKSVPEKIKTRVELLKDVLGLNKSTNQPEEPEDPNEYEIPQVEINRFNAKFEFYTGESVSADNVKTLLEVVKNNLSSMEITNIEEEQNPENPNPVEINPEDIRINIKLNIEKDKDNSVLVTQAMNRIKTGKKYKVSIKYKQENGLIENINITELEN